MTAGTVYTEGTWDLLHYNHIEMLRSCLEFGDRLVVGVISDRWVSSYKRQPILTGEERLRAIRALGFVDHAFLLDGPFTAELMRQLLSRYNPVAVVYGSAGFDGYFAPAEELGIMKRLPYRPGLTSSEIIDRVVRTHGGNGETSG